MSSMIAAVSERSAESLQTTTENFSRQAIRNRVILVIAGLVVSVLVCFTLDNRLNAFFSAGGLPGDLERTILLCEAFAHGGGVMLILFVLFSVDTVRWRQLVVVAGCALWSGLAADFIKLFVHRLRPSAMAERGADAIASFQSWGLSTVGEILAEHAHTQQSFPSAHTATAFGFALGLIWFYQRGHVAFLMLATLAGIQRMVVGAHWPSDVIGGATVGFAITPIVIGLSERFWCCRLPHQNPIG